MTAVIPAQRSPESDRWQLVARAQTGDPTAFADLYRLYQPTVFRFVYQRCRDRQLAEDITGDTFVRLLRGINTVTWQGRDPAAWLVTVARNLLADHYKSSRYRYERLGGGDSQPEDPDTDRRTDPANVAVHNSLAVLLGSALAELTVEQRAVLALRFGAGLSITETAAAMGKDPNAIKALQYRAVRSAQVLLRRAGVTPC